MLLYIINILLGSILLFLWEDDGFDKTWLSYYLDEGGMVNYYSTGGGGVNIRNPRVTVYNLYTTRIYIITSMRGWWVW